MGAVSQLFADAGTLVLSSFISPYREDRSDHCAGTAMEQLCHVLMCSDVMTYGVRDRVKSSHEQAGLPFLEVFVDCPLETAEQRCVKWFMLRHAHCVCAETPRACTRRLGRARSHTLQVLCSTVTLLLLLPMQSVP